MPVVGTDGEKVRVFCFEMYDIGSDRFVQSKRWATLKFIERVNAQRIGHGVEVDGNQVDADGLTEPGFSPLPNRDGFQREVRSSLRK